MTSTLKTQLILATTAYYLLTALGGALKAAPHQTSETPSQNIEILVFTRTEGFAHGSIADGIKMLETIAQEEGHDVTVTDETTLFTASGLAAFDVVVWLSTTGDVLDDPEQAAFEDFIQTGGGYVGIHAAADCEYNWQWYGELLGNGAWFRSHPSIQTATLELEDASHSAAGFPDAQTSFIDEWYNFRVNPRPAVDVIMTLDEGSYDPGSNAMGEDHPIVWAHEFQGGRAFYTGLGHRSQTFEDARFISQIRGALVWAGGTTGELFADGFESGSTADWDSTM